MKEKTWLYDGETYYNLHVGTPAKGQIIAKQREKEYTITINYADWFPARAHKLCLTPIKNPQLEAQLCQPKIIQARWTL